MFLIILIHFDHFVFLLMRQLFLSYLSISDNYTKIIWFFVIFIINIKFFSSLLKIILSNPVNSILKLSRQIRTIPLPVQRNLASFAGAYNGTKVKSRKLLLSPTWFWNTLSDNKTSTFDCFSRSRKCAGMITLGGY